MSGWGRYREPPYASCYEPVSEDPTAVAFEAWQVAGEETLHAGLPRLPLAERTELLQQVRLAVAVLSTAPDPIVHHDLKFDNVMLKAQDSRGRSGSIAVPVPAGGAEEGLERQLHP